MIRAAVIYHVWPHYREAVALTMDQSKKIKYSFFGSGESYLGIKHADTSEFRDFVRAPFHFFGRLMWQQKAVEAALGSNYDVIIYLGDPNFASTWIGAILARIRKKPVLMWAHGWRREETRAKRRMRNLFFGLANRILVYNERAKVLGATSGYPANRITVVYNSLDVERADKVIERIEGGLLRSIRPQDLFSDPSLPTIICTARITLECNFNLLLDAAQILLGRNEPINVLLIGDGPERARLEDDAIRRKLSIHFYGACYDEEVLGQLIYWSDITVSPGKIGLTAMHSLMYGTPAITHSNLADQMPEVEAIEQGRSGLLFEQNNPKALADAISLWLSAKHSRGDVRSKCRAAIHKRWNPLNQAVIIERAIIEVLRND